MAPTRTARTAAAKENGTAAETAAAADGTPVKRGRGRPPKNGIAPQAKKAPSGRPRGRPPGTGGGVKKAAKATPAKAAGTSGPGRRGRPRKSDADATTTPKKGATPKSASKTSSTGKGRGRPRKSDVSPVEEPEEDEDAEHNDDDEDDANEDIAMEYEADENDAEDDDAAPQEVRSPYSLLPLCTYISQPLIYQ
ncbi:uncharacterized protein F4812DRAFT_442322 [Daldinia caldariorum]|uniref:uncharacterized protein n=1 Tax=Daldinia caldariorum TaxID=326644 RepID=UPI00200866FD|nr:uncharacterized protein F4812DRAFT_442322 [Daldinia caldariorum]KAI1464488.1 hypothetical protein F4812DRAFT_442322 [Daldinia caldariorum]